MPVHRSTEHVRPAYRLTMQATGKALAMHYLHSFNPAIVHRDLRSPNILVGPHWVPKVGTRHSKTCALFTCSRVSAPHLCGAHQGRY